MSVTQYSRLDQNSTDPDKSISRGPFVHANVCKCRVGEWVHVGGWVHVGEWVSGYAWVGGCTWVGGWVGFLTSLKRKSIQHDDWSSCPCELGRPALSEAPDHPWTVVLMEQMVTLIIKCDVHANLSEQMSLSVVEQVPTKYSFVPNLVFRK